VKVASNLKWSFVGQFTYAIIYLIFNILLSRILPPEDFGLFAILNTFTIFFNLIKDFGLGNYLIVQKVVTKDLCDNIFYINTFFTALLFLIMFFISPILASFYNDERLTMLIRISGVAFIIDSFTTVPLSIMTRNMNFFGLFVVKSISVLVAGIIALIFALYGFGVYSLLSQTIALSVSSCIIIYYLNPFIPGVDIGVGDWRKVIKFSIPLFLNQLFQYFSRNIDNLLIGRLFGIYPLGIYNRAYTLMQIPMQNITSVVSGVLLPTLSKVNHDKELRAQAYKKALLRIAFVTFPLMAYVFVFAKEIILLLYGSAWIEVADLLMLFAIVGMLETVISPVGTLLLSAGKTSKLLKFSTLIRLFIIGMIFLGSSISVKGIASCYLAATVLIFPYSLYYTAVQLEKQFTYLFYPLIQIFGVALIVGILVFIIKIFMSSLHVGLLLFLSASIYLSVYLLISFFFTRLMMDCFSFESKNIFLK
jgi:PST family polysaccharide transporter